MIRVSFCENVFAGVSVFMYLHTILFLLSIFFKEQLKEGHNAHIIWFV